MFACLCLTYCDCLPWIGHNKHCAHSLLRMVAGRGEGVRVWVGWNNCDRFSRSLKKYPIRLTIRWLCYRLLVLTESC